MSVLEDVVEIPIYTSNDLTWEDFFGEDYGKVKAQFPKLDYGAAEAIVKISDYNKIAKLYGTEQYELKDDEYIVLCDYDNMAEIRNQVLNEGGHKLTIAGKEYKSK